ATPDGSRAESGAAVDGAAADQVEADGLLLGAAAAGTGTISAASAPTSVDGVAGARVAAGSVATLLSQADPAEQLTARRWRAGDDVRHTEYGHGWVQGSGHGRVTIRFETRRTGPGQARTMADDDPGLTPADPLASLD
ncbi:MAG: polymerase, partial [Pseudonocardiales bacterium]|nr:polymerase [Pseudonocardiales bacterium]